MVTTTFIIKERRILGLPPRWLRVYCFKFSHFVACKCLIIDLRLSWSTWRKEINKLTDIAQPILDLTLQEDRFDKLDVLFLVRVHAVSHMFSSQRLKTERCDIKSLETIRLRRGSKYKRIERWRITLLSFKDLMFAKSFLICGCMRSGLLECARISSISSFETK